MGAVVSIGQPEQLAPHGQPEAIRYLRIGVVHRGRIIEEQVLAPERSFTVGAHPRATLLLPGDGGPPERLELFAQRGGQLHLRLSPRLRGKVDLGEGVVTLDRLRADGQRLVRLPSTARGKVQVGDFTLLFQLVDPPARPKTRSARLVNWGDVDWVFLALVLVSSLMHAAAVLWLQSQPPPSRLELQEMGREFVTIALPAPAPEPATEPAPPDPEAEPVLVPESPSPEAASPEPAPSPEPAGEPGGTPSAGPDVNDLGMLAIIGTTENETLEGLLDLDSSSLDDEAMNAMLASNQFEIARERTPLGIRGPTAVGEGAATVGALEGVGGCSNCAVPQQKERRAPKVPELVVTPPSLPDSAFDIAPFLKRLRPRFKACYERALKGNPDLGGRVAFSFVTDGAARVGEAWIDVDSMGSEQANACILAEVRRLSLPPEAADLEVAGYGLMFTAQ